MGAHACTHACHTRALTHTHAHMHTLTSHNLLLLLLLHHQHQLLGVSSKPPRVRLPR
jgi:hypothetical protein